MACLLCNLESAIVEERRNPAEVELRCRYCGNVKFTATADAEVRNLSAEQKSLLSEYCHRYSRAPEFPTITHVRLYHMIEEMSATRAAELLRAELNRKKRQ